MAQAQVEQARYPDLEGRSVFVSGGGSGIGAAIVAAFAAQGARVSFIDIADDPSHVLVSRLGAERVRYQRCDVRDIAAFRGAGCVRPAQYPREQCGARRPPRACRGHA